jgi:hypothetical protein
MKKPYIKKFGEISGFNVWIVDGKYIRDNLDIEFTNFGQPLDFPIIPKNELWIDKEYSGNENRFFIAHMLAEHRLMAEGKKFDQAREYANKIERKERANSKLYKRICKKIKHKEEIIKKIHKKPIKKYSNNKVKIWIVNGELVRDLFFSEFTEGGNDQIYSFVPNGEIWLDDDLNEREIRFVLLHELHERNLMKKGWPYWLSSIQRKSAHWSASKIEHFCRKYPKFTDAKIKDELRKIK